MNPKEAKRYESQYPHYLPWSRRVHVLNQGQVLEKEDRAHYKVVQIVRSPINGEPPRIVLERMEDDNITS